MGYVTSSRKGSSPFPGGRSEGVRLSMGTAGNVSQGVRKFESVSERSLTPELREWKKG